MIVAGCTYDARPSADFYCRVVRGSGIVERCMECGLTLVRITAMDGSCKGDIPATEDS